VERKTEERYTTEFQKQERGSRGVRGCSETMEGRRSQESNVEEINSDTREREKMETKREWTRNPNVTNERSILKLLHEKKG